MELTPEIIAKRQQSMYFRDNMLRTGVSKILWMDFKEKCEERNLDPQQTSETIIGLLSALPRSNYDTDKGRLMLAKPRIPGSTPYYHPLQIWDAFAQCVNPIPP